MVEREKIVGKQTGAFERFVASERTKLDDYKKDLAFRFSQDVGLTLSEYSHVLPRFVCLFAKKDENFIDYSLYVYDTKNQELLSVPIIFKDNSHFFESSKFSHRSYLETLLETPKFGDYTIEDEEGWLMHANSIARGLDSALANLKAGKLPEIPIDERTQKPLFDEEQFLRESKEDIPSQEILIMVATLPQRSPSDL